MKVLIAEDEKDLNRLMVKTLKKAGYHVDAAFDGEEALLFMMGSEYDAILLDIMMPKKDGREVLKELRSKGIQTPVLFLTARDSIEDRVEGLDLGADDYLVKPFAFEELLARIRAAARKRVGSRSNRLTLANLSIDLERRTVFRDETEIYLLPKEYAILEYMMMNQGIVLSRQQIEERVWNLEASLNSNNVDVYMSKLRKKMDDGFTPKLLHTIRGVGFVLREEKNG